tara:strand:- start:498 stop:959 length:462 start_codon:yes stop_codon:yes gene_type:complete
MQSCEFPSNSVLYCQQNRTQELNNRIFSRNNPYFHQPPRFSHNPVHTKRVKFPVLSSNNICTNTSKKNGFNVNLETVLQNRQFALQKTELDQYVPSSTSTLYNDYVPNFVPVNNPHTHLNNSKINNNFNPNSYNLAKHTFNNSTRTDLLNVKK